MRALVLVACAACGELASPELGLGDLLYVDGAQYRPGGFPAQSGGPDVLTAQTDHTMIVIGTNREALSAVLAPDTRSTIVGIPGAAGTWIVPAGPPDFETPGDPSLHATFGINAALGPGPFEIDVAAVDASERIGAPAAIDLLALDAPPPDGDLVVTLAWIGTADLDLHVIDPAGEEAWQGHPNTWQQPPPGTVGVDPCAWASGGILDHDANSSCVRDANPSEDVIWTTRSCGGQMIAPAIASGQYIVRVEASSLCQDASAPWAVMVFHEGQLIGAARGISTQADVDYAPHGTGAGVTALAFSL